MKRLIALMLITTILLLTGCGVPLKTQRIDHVYAIAWEDNGQPIALGQEIEFTDTYVIASPDGAMESEQHLQYGPLVLLTRDEIKDVDSPLLKGKEWGELKMARPIAGDSGFMAVLSIPTGEYYDTEELGVSVDFQGNVKEFFRRDDYAEYLISPDGRSLYMHWRSKADKEPVFERIDLGSGEVEPAEEELAKMATRFDDSGDSILNGLPCRPGYLNTQDCLSPDGKLLAFSCCDDDSCRVYVFDVSRQSRLVATVPSTHITPRDDFEEIKARYLYIFHTLAWSPEQSRLYFCQGPGRSGYVIDVQSGQTKTITPGLMAASWSPDGTRVAGMDSTDLVVIEP